MAQSNTEQAASFWKKQVMQLQERLWKIRSSDCKQTALAKSSPSQGHNYHENQHDNDSICAYVTMKDEENVLKSTEQGSEPISTITISQDAQNENHQVPMKVISSPTYTFKNNEFAKIFQQQLSKDMPVVNVISPANLPEGYTFEAEMGHTRFLALVVSIS